jgi:ribosome-binding protein aMBF1 (putative translation factor)
LEERVEQTRLQVARTAYTLGMHPRDARSLTRGMIRRFQRVQQEASGDAQKRRMSPGEELIRDDVFD